MVTLIDLKSIRKTTTLTLAYRKLTSKAHILLKESYNLIAYQSFNVFISSCLLSESFQNKSSTELILSGRRGIHNNRNRIKYQAYLIFVEQQRCKPLSSHTCMTRNMLTEK